jgi:hypothetical protein
MTEKEHLIVCMIEECSEVQKILCKILRFGVTEEKLSDLSDEMHDLVAVSEMLADIGIVPSEIQEEKITKKQNKVRKNMKGKVSE